VTARPAHRGLQTRRAATRRAPSVALDNRVPVPPFIGRGSKRGFPRRDRRLHQRKPRFFRNQWGTGPWKAKPTPFSKARVRAVLRRAIVPTPASRVCAPPCLRYFAANADGTTSSSGRAPGAPRSWPARFPRQEERPLASIADFFRPWRRGESDYGGLPRRDHGLGVSEETAVCSLLTATATTSLARPVRPR